MGIASLLGASVAQPPAGGGFGWIDLVVALGVLAGIVLLGLYGDVVVGGVIFGVVTVIEAGARVSARAVRSVVRRRSRTEPATPLAGTRAVSVEGRWR